MNLRQDGDFATVIGESMRISGNLIGDEDLHVHGRVDGSIELKKTLIVVESGIIKAEVSVKNAVISGVVVGNIRAEESVEITKEGRMVGDIVAPTIIIVDGASFHGNIDMGTAAPKDTTQSMNRSQSSGFSRSHSQESSSPFSRPAVRTPRRTLLATRTVAPSPASTAAPTNAAAPTKKIVEKAAVTVKAPTLTEKTLKDVKSEVVTVSAKAPVAAMLSKKTKKKRSSAKRK